MFIPRFSSKSRLGDLVVVAGMVPQDVITSSLVVAQKASMPLGRVLMMAGALNEREVSSALGVQQMIREGVIATDTAVRALQEVRTRKVALNQALEIIGYKRQGPVYVHNLGDFLIAAGVATTEAITAVARRCADTGWLLGRNLVSSGEISLQILWACLELRVLVTAGHLSAHQALKILEMVHFQKLPLPDAFKNAGCDMASLTERPRVGELMAQAHILNDGDAAFALEVALETGERFGHVLLKLNLTSEEVLVAALQLQQMVRHQKIQIAHAVQLLQYVHTLRTPLRDILEELKRIGRVLDMIADAGLPIKMDAVDSAQFENSMTQIDRILLIAKQVDESTLHIAQTFLQMVDYREMTYEEAVAALREELSLPAAEAEPHLVA